jgi:O-6-methylguanine DNA methyltransferase
MFERAFLLHTTRDGHVLGLGATWCQGRLYQVDLVSPAVVEDPEAFWLTRLPEAIQQGAEADLTCAAPLWADLAERLEGGEGHAWDLWDRGTPFQKQVREALLRIPRGDVRSYQQLAIALDHPSAARAVARGCASNPFALLVPCHRVVGSRGQLSGYRWGTALKQWLLEREGAWEAPGLPDPTTRVPVFA